MDEFFCNPLDEDLLDVEVSTGGFFSDPELGVIESLPNVIERMRVPARGARVFAVSTWDEYREFVLHWLLRYRTESGGLTAVSFGTFKELDDCESLDVTPMLEGSTFVVPRGA